MYKRKEVLSWCFFDFANSSYSAVIAAVVFPVYFTKHIVPVDGELWWGRAISLSMAIVALSSPILGGIADIAGLRKRFMIAYTLVCVSAVSMFSFIEPSMAMQGFALVVIANIAMEGGLVFYNSFLTVIADRHYQGRVSSWGFGVGYAGSILSLALAIPLVKAGMFNAVWIMVAVFFLVCSLPAFIWLPADRKNGNVLGAGQGGVREVWKTFREIWSNRNSRRFLTAYFIYEDGVNTVIVFSSIYAAVTLGFQTSELILLYIVVQFTALIGAFAMAKPVDLWGPKRVVSISLLMWTAVSVLAYLVESKACFWVIATIAGTGLGTVQASTRAFFARFIPIGRESEYFGVYSLAGKSSAVIGPLLFGTITSLTGSQRPAILMIAVFFLVGLAIVRTVKE